jgi:adenylate kinase family enzyme
MNRKASCWEELYALSAAKGLRLVSVLLQFTGPIVNSTNIQQSLKSTILKHPILHSKLVYDEESKHFNWFPNHEGSLYNFSTIKLQNGETNDAIKYIEQQAHIPIPICGPYMKCIHFLNTKINILAFIYSHAIMDGNSRNMFLYDFMKQLQTKEEIVTANDYMYITEEEMFRTISGDKYREISASLPHISSFVKLPKTAHESDNHNNNVQFGMTYRTLDNISKLVKKCREHHCTVQAAIISSLTSSNSWTKYLIDPCFSILTPVALRPKLVSRHKQGQLIVSTLGNLQWSITGSFSASFSTEQSAFWDTANLYKKSLSKYENNIVPSFSIYAIDCVQNLGAYGGFEKLHWGEFSENPPFTMIVSNVGSIEILSQPFGAYTVIAATAFAAETSAFPFITVNTIQEKMTIAATYPLKYFNRNQIECLLDESILVLTKLITDDNNNIV